MSDNKSSVFFLFLGVIFLFIRIVTPIQNKFLNYFLIISGIVLIIYGTIKIIKK